MINSDAMVNLLPRRNNLVIYVIYFKMVREPLVCRVILCQLGLNEDLNSVKCMRVHLRINRQNRLLTCLMLIRTLRSLRNSRRLCLHKAPNWSVLRQCLTNLFSVSCRNNLNFKILTWSISSLSIPQQVLLY